MPIAAIRSPHRGSSSHMLRAQISVCVFLLLAKPCFGDGWKHIKLYEIYGFLALLFLGPPLLGTGLARVIKKRGSWKLFLGSTVLGTTAAVLAVVTQFLTMESVSFASLFIAGGLLGGALSFTLFWRKA